MTTKHEVIRANQKNYNAVLPKSNTTGSQKLKDQDFTLCRITIRKIRSVTKKGPVTSYKNKMWIAIIDDKLVRKSFNATNKKDFFKRLKEELYL